jgi:hypothetical protein
MATKSKVVSHSNNPAFYLFSSIYCLFSLYAAIEVEYQSREILLTVDLPQAEISSNMSVDEAIQNRRSVRSFSTTSLTLQDVSQLLWAAQGITDSERNFRATPSADMFSLWRSIWLQ